MLAPELSGYDVAHKAREALGPLDLWLSLGLAQPGPLQINHNHAGTAWSDHKRVHSTVGFFLFLIIFYSIF
jgi:hypothetical protein